MKRKEAKITDNKKFGKDHPGKTVSSRPRAFKRSKNEGRTKKLKKKIIINKNKSKER